VPPPFRNQNRKSFDCAQDKKDGARAFISLESPFNSFAPGRSSTPVDDVTQPYNRVGVIWITQRSASRRKSHTIDAIVTMDTSNSAPSMSLSLTDDFRGESRCETRCRQERASRISGETRHFERTLSFFSILRPLKTVQKCAGSGLCRPLHLEPSQSMRKLSVLLFKRRGEGCASSVFPFC
jgi:hypothetical protein